jgi:hypothetical protein
VPRSTPIPTTGASTPNRSPAPAAGPALSWGEQTFGEPALRAAEDAVRLGAIIAVKGLGGYQLVCDATDAAAVQRLRTRKRRPRKPFAVMVADLAAAEGLAVELSAAERALKMWPACPVVLVDARPGTALAPRYAPRRPVPAGGAAAPPAALEDAAVLPPTGTAELVVSTDSFVVRCSSRAGTSAPWPCTAASTMRR